MAVVLMIKPQDSSGLSDENQTGDPVAHHLPGSSAGLRGEIPSLRHIHILLLSIFSLGFNLLFGYTGLLSFGQRDSTP